MDEGSPVFFVERRGSNPLLHDGLEDAALLLVAHGSTLNSDSAEPAYFHAEAMRRLGCFQEVRVCFWKEQPVVSAGLRGIQAARVFVVPLFISEGYFTERVIPRELGLCRDGETNWARVQTLAGRQIHYCSPVGTHPGMSAVILERAETALGEGSSGWDDRAELKNVSLFLAGHGTSQHENSRQAIEAHARRLAALGRFREVHSVFMEEAPRIQAVYELASAENIVVVPFFIADGLHTAEDIPVLLGEAPEVVQARLAAGAPPWTSPTVVRGKRVWYGAAIGREAKLADVILERVRESARQRTDPAGTPEAVQTAE